MSPAKASGQDPVVIELREQTRWLRLLGLQTMKPLIAAMTDPSERLAYELSYGERSSRQIAQLVARSQTKVVRWWSSWCATGIASDTGGGRARRLVSLRDLGIDVPEKRGLDAGLANGVSEAAVNGQ